MSSNLENNYLRLRVRQLVDSYPEPSVLGDCDCTSYSYFLLSIILLTLGVYITVPALGGADHYVFSNLGHMWLVGPICICCGAMVAIKSVLYLRRKSVIKMLLRQRALLRVSTFSFVFFTLQKSPFVFYMIQCSLLLKVVNFWNLYSSVRC